MNSWNGPENTLCKLGDVENAAEDLPVDEYPGLARDRRMRMVIEGACCVTPLNRKEVSRVDPISIGTSP